MVEGTHVGGYRLISRLGEGGMGVVWLAEHVRLGRRAAIKVLHARMSADPDIVTRFFNEARAATAISDPGIVQIYDFGNHTDGSAYIVMELLDGEPLDARLRQRGTMRVIDALRIIRQVASSLGAAHARNIVHRDLKPENIFIVRDPEVPGGERAKILDFGIAKLIGEGHGAQTKASAVMGTPTFMSPEQCRGAGKVDQRTDVYALGCVLYVLLAGRAPFEAEGMGEVLMMHMVQPPPVPSASVRDIPPAIDALVLRCLAKDAAARYANGAELALAIDSLLSELPTGQRAVTSPVAIASSAPTIASSVTAPTTLSSAASGLPSPPANRRRTIVIAGAALGVAALVAIIAVASSGSRQDSARPRADEASPVATSAALAPVPTAAPVPTPAPVPTTTAPPAPVPATPALVPTTAASVPSDAPVVVAAHQLPIPTPAPAKVASATIKQPPTTASQPPAVVVPQGTNAGSGSASSAPVARFAPAKDPIASVSPAPIATPAPTSIDERQTCLKRRSDVLKRAQQITDLAQRTQMLKSAPVCGQGQAAVQAEPPKVAAPAAVPKVAAPAAAPPPAPAPSPPPQPAVVDKTREACLQQRISILRRAKEISDLKQRTQLLKSAPVCDK